MSAEYRVEYLEFIKRATNRANALCVRYLMLLPPDQRKTVADKMLTVIRWSFDQGYNSRVRSGQQVLFGGGERRCVTCGKVQGETT